MSYQSEIFDRMNETADVDLGTVVSALDGRGMFDEASVLELCRLRYDVLPDNWIPQRIAADLLVDPLLLGSITPEIITELDSIIGMIHGDSITWEGVRIVPRRVSETWREGRAAARISEGGPGNQATYKTLPETAPSRGRIRFGSDEEAKVFDALVKVQQRRPPEQTLGIIPGCAFRVLVKTYWPDFVITHRGRAAAIEVDGPHHYGRAAHDQSRDRLLEDAGLLFVERIVVEDTANEAELELFVERFLARLLSR